MGTYSRRLTRNRRPLSAELLCLLVVVAGSVLTAWYAGHAVVPNLSIIQTAVAFLGVNATSTAPQVGYSPGRQQEQPAAGQAAPAAADSARQFCQSSETPAFANGMAALKQQLGDAMGTPVECEHVASVGGDTIQQTSTGLAAYNRSTNTVTFTDGWRHWALTANGFVTWDGTEANPPANAVEANGDAGASPNQDQ